MGTLGRSVGPTVEGEDFGVVEEAVHRRRGQQRVAEEAIPVSDA